MWAVASLLYSSPPHDTQKTLKLVHGHQPPTGHQQEWRMGQLRFSPWQSSDSPVLVCPRSLQAAEDWAGTCWMDLWCTRSPGRPWNRTIRWSLIINWAKDFKIKVKPGDTRYYRKISAPPCGRFYGDMICTCCRCCEANPTESRCLSPPVGCLWWPPVA